MSCKNIIVEDSQQQTQSSNNAPLPRSGSNDLEKHSITNSTSESVDFDIPDGGYGWVVVVCSMLINGCCWGGISGFSVVLAHYLQFNTYEGGTKIDYAVISGLCFGSGLIFSPFIVYLIGITNFRMIMCIGALAQFASLMCASYSTKIYQIYLTSGVLSGFALALMASNLPSIIPQWFSRRRSLAMGISAAGSGCGGLMFNLALQRIIDISSVQWAIRAQAIIVGVVVFTCSLLLRTRGDVIKPKFTAWDNLVACSFPFWMLASWYVFTMLSYVTLQYVIADATKSLGYSPDQGSITSALMAAGVIVGRPILGHLSDAFGSITIGMLTYSLCGVLCLAMWLPASNLATIYAFSMIEGATMGFIWGAMGAIIPRITGLKRSPVTFGMSWIFIGGAGIVAPIIGLALKRPEKSVNQYNDVAIFSGICFLVAAASLCILRAYIIARDDIAAQNDSGTSNLDDDKELKIRVDPNLVWKNIMVIKPRLKV
ncbi:Mch2 protein [Saccharomycopsis crataegensis]|uniref:Mch2 protein n=1 Tax=Saccharomycopsis crataegensis TaxID=43959 RepID=A0AAV5QEQ3_9ASCO|nr:Mch2 protein [Saccharomycopsis crataegensis]